MPRPEWVKAGLAFHEAEQLQAYGLNGQKGAAKSFLIVMQVTSWTLLKLSLIHI